MHLTAFISVTFALLGMAAANPVANNNNFAFQRSNLDSRACDCPGVRACCKQCMIDLGGNDGIECCNTTCMDKFPGCYNAC